MSWLEICYLQQSAKTESDRASCLYSLRPHSGFLSIDLITYAGRLHDSLMIMSGLQVLRAQVDTILSGFIVGLALILFGDWLSNFHIGSATSLNYLSLSTKFTATASQRLTAPNIALHSLLSSDQHQSYSMGLNQNVHTRGSY